jgi:hypothetical protein
MYIKMLVDGGWTSYRVSSLVNKNDFFLFLFNHSRVCLLLFLLSLFYYCKYIMPYIPEDKLEGLTRYRYGGIDKSYVSKHILGPYWTNLVKIFPLWMA